MSGNSDWNSIAQTRRHLVGFAWRSGMVKICQVQFHRSGFFIHFPYHPSKDGVIARCDVGRGSEVTVDYSDTGYVVSHRVKYSHPADGRAHFSQDGRIRTVVRNQAKDLSDQSGFVHLFSIDVQGLNQFAELSSATYYSDRYGRCLFEMNADEPPDAIHIVGRWGWPDKPVHTLRNPVKLRGPQGDPSEHIALAAPPTSPIAGALMLIDLVPRQPLPDSPDHLLIFSGGFEEGLGDSTVESSFLMMKYPATAMDLPSADYIRAASRESPL